MNEKIITDGGQYGCPPLPITPTPTPNIKFGSRKDFELICVSKCKRFALEVVKSNPCAARANKFTRVSQDFLLSCEAALKEHIRSRIKCHPSKGKTLM